jgi:hypothetical protein
MLRFYHRVNTSNMYLKFMQAHRDQPQRNELTRGPLKKLEKILLACLCNKLEDMHGCVDLCACWFSCVG